MADKSEPASVQAQAMCWAVDDLEPYDPATLKKPPQYPTRCRREGA